MSSWKVMGIICPCWHSSNPAEPTNRSSANLVSGVSFALLARQPLSNDMQNPKKTPRNRDFLALVNSFYGRILHRAVDAASNDACFESSLDYQPL
jgi:hypothetical protein